MSDDDELIVPTRVGRALFDDHDHLGWRVFRDLAGHESYTGLIALAITGERRSPDEVAMLDDVAACMTIAEPRIWPMKVARLVASYGRVVPAALAGSLCFESASIGPMTANDAARDLVALHAETHGNPTSEAIAAWRARRGRLVGYGVPFRPHDERVVALGACVERRGRAALPMWSFASALWRVLRDEHRLEPNIASAIAAVCLDLRIAPETVGPLCVALLHNIFWANAIEGAAQTPEILRRLPDDRIDYVGRAPRKSPRAT